MTTVFLFSVIPPVQRSLGLVDIKVEICDVADVSTALTKQSEAAVLLQEGKDVYNMSK